MTREVAGKTGVRFERLSDKVHHPTKIAAYQNAKSLLKDWDQNCQDLAKVEGQSISELTKRTILKGMVPQDLVRDLERDSTFKTFAAAWKFVLEQVPLRKEWEKQPGKKGANDVDVDLAEGDEA